MTIPTEAQIAELSEAVWQVLDDWGADGKVVCDYTRMKLRIAFEPFVEWNPAPDYTFEAAKKMLAEFERTS